MRRFLPFLFAALLSAAEPDITIVMIPDPQNMATALQASKYNGMMQWIIDNQAAENIQLVISVGDLMDGPSGPNAQVANAAFQMLDIAGIDYVIPPGNHDLTAQTAPHGQAWLPWTQIAGQGSNLTVISGSTVHSATYSFNGSDVNQPLYVRGGTGWTQGQYIVNSLSGSDAVLDRSPGADGITGGVWWRGYGIFSPTIRALYPSFGGNLNLYPELNWWIKKTIGTRRIAVFAVDFLAGAEELTRWKAIHDQLAAQGYEIWVTTHPNIFGATASDGHLAVHNDVFTIDGTNNYGYLDGARNATCLSDPASSSCGLAPADAWDGHYTAWPNLMYLHSGHYPVGPAGQWISREIDSTSYRAQSTGHVYANYQDIAPIAGYLVLLKQSIERNVIEESIYNTTTNQWIQANGSLGAGRVILWSVPLKWLKPRLMPGQIGR